MERYEVIVRVAGSRFYEAESPDDALRLAVEEARVAARDIEAADILGAAFAEVDTVMDTETSTSIPLGEVGERTVWFDSEPIAPSERQ